MYNIDFIYDWNEIISYNITAINKSMSNIYIYI